MNIVLPQRGHRWQRGQPQVPCMGRLVGMLKRNRSFWRGFRDQQSFKGKWRWEPSRMSPVHGLGIGAPYQAGSCFQVFPINGAWSLTWGVVVHLWGAGSGQFTARSDPLSIPATMIDHGLYDPKFDSRLGEPLAIGTKCGVSNGRSLQAARLVNRQNRRTLGTHQTGATLEV